MLGRSYVVFGIAFLFAIWILIISARLQLGVDNEFGELLKKKNTRISDIKAIRGNIYANGENLLATTTTKYTLVIDAIAEGLTDQLLDENLNSLSLNLASLFKEKSALEWKNHILELRKNKRRYAILQKDIDYGYVKLMRNWPIINLGRYKGFYFEEKGERLYFLGDLARKAIGSVKGGAYTGLEGAFDSLLRGVNGKQIEQRMPGGVWRSIKTANYNQPKNGYDIITTLDVQIQDVAQYALSKAMVNNKAERGCALVMDVKTGAIKAMANLKRGTDDQYYESRNYAIDDYSEPGSTVKLLSALALLSDKYCTPTDSIDINWGRYEFNDKVMVDATPPKKTILTLHEAFQLSSNVGISKLVNKYYKDQPEKFIKYFKLFGLDNAPNFDIKSSNFPVINQPSYEGWSANSLPWLSIGYESRLSPLQILSVYNTIANNGVMMKPYMVKELRHQGRTISEIKPEILKEQIANQEVINQLKAMMESVVSNGTANNLKSDDYKIAGKTGTAQIAIDNKGYIKGAYKASFAGYLPAENPQYSIIVVINQPKDGQYYGGSVAGPVFKEISDYIFSRNNSINKLEQKIGPENFPEVYTGQYNKTKFVLDNLGVSSNTIGTRTLYTEIKKGQYGVQLHPYPSKNNEIPNIVGMGLRDALHSLEKLGLKVKYSGKGKVKTQSPLPGAIFKKGNTVTIELN